MQEHTPKIEQDLPATQDPAGNPIAVGTVVRSFDFSHVGIEPALEGERACFVEGEVLGVAREGWDCPRYAIRPTRRVFAGEDCPDEVGEIVYPPLNGTQSSLGGETRAVHVVTEAKAANTEPTPPTEQELQDASAAGSLWVYAMGYWYAASYVRIKRTGTIVLRYTSGAGTTREKTVKPTAGFRIGDRPQHVRARRGGAR